MTQIGFFATRDDIMKVLDDVERSVEVKYIRTGNRTTKDFEEFASAAELPNLGEADSASEVSCSSYLIGLKTTAFTVRTVGSASRGLRYCMDQLYNPDAIGFTPAGVWHGDVIVSGCVGSASGSPVSQSLMKRFGSAFRKHFIQVQTFRLGPNAVSFLKGGKRLTQAVQSPPEYDLQLPAGLA